MSHLPHLGAALSALGAAVALSGCTAAVDTAVTVTGPNTATVRVSATFTGEAADTIAGNSATRDQLLRVFSDRTGRAPQIDQDRAGHRFTVEQDLTYGQLATSAPVVGLSGLSLSGTADEATLNVTLVPPARLNAAVTSATAAQPDGAALARTMLRSTTLSVHVLFPGGISRVTGPAAAAARIEGDQVSLTRTADATAVQRLSVTGDPTPSRWPWLAGLGAAAGAGVVVLLRRRRRDGS